MYGQNKILILGTYTIHHILRICTCLELFIKTANFQRQQISQIKLVVQTFIWKKLLNRMWNGTYKIVHGEKVSLMYWRICCSCGPWTQLINHVTYVYRNVNSSKKRRKHSIFMEWCQPNCISHNNKRIYAYSESTKTMSLCYSAR